MILELDIGNTRAKFRLFDVDGLVSDRGDGAVSDWVRAGLPPTWSDRICRIRAASVVGSEVESSLAERIRSDLGLEVEFARSCAEVGGVRNAYADPQSLGVDRWLALLAAYKRISDAVLVIDIGSALTVDLVDRDGMHRGGYIIPGPRLMQTALLRDTERVRFGEQDSLSALAFGCDTAGCVGAGIAAAQVGAVLVARQLARTIVGGDVRVFITGGWGAELGERLDGLDSGEYVLASELVLDGLRWALP